MSAFKYCTKCGELKHLDDYAIVKQRRDGTMSRRADCKECRAERRREERWAERGMKPPPKQSVKSRKQMLAEKREMQLAYRRRNIETYLAEHGSTPECECGCGENVNFNANGKPNRFMVGHAARKNRMEYSEAMRKRRAEMREDSIPIEDFTSAVREYKESHGLTWAQVANGGGISREHLNTIIYEKSRTSKAVGREWATNFFRRLAGLPAPPGPEQLRKMESMKRASKETESRL